MTLASLQAASDDQGKVKVYARIRPLKPVEVENQEDQVSALDKVGSATKWSRNSCVGLLGKKGCFRTLQKGGGDGTLCPSMSDDIKLCTSIVFLRAASLLTILRPSFSKHPKIPSL